MSENLGEHAQAGYPMPGSKPMEIKGTEIEYIVIAPKGYKGGAATSQEAQQALPKDKPLKVDGSQLESVTLTPKGTPAQEGSHEGEQEKKEKEGGMEEKIKQLTSERDDFKSKYEQLLAERRSALSSQIVELKKEDGVVKEEEAAAFKKELETLDEVALKVMLADTRKIHAKFAEQIKDKGTAKVRFTGSENLTDEQKKRLELFGHPNPPGTE